MSNFVSGIFKKRKYGGYFIIYLIAFINLIGFGYGASNCLEPYDNISSQYDDSYNNCDYQDNLIVCVWGQVGNVEFPDYGPTYNLQSAPLCTLLAYNEYITVHSWNSEYQILVFPSVEEPPAPPDCPESVCNVIVYDNLNMQSTNTQYGVEPGNITNITLSYNSSNSSYSVGGSNSNPIYTFSPSSSLINCSSNLSTCNNQLNTLSGNYNTCLSNLSNCQLTPPNCSNCETDLLNCGTQLNTMSGNYNTCLGELDSCMAGAYNTGDLQRSALYINNIQHLGKPIIQIDIPEEIQRNYNSTGDYFNLNVEGYGYDEEKMLNIIDIQNYKPTGEEMSNLIGKFADFVPLLGICLLFIAIRYIAKKIFRG